MPLRSCGLHGRKLFLMFADPTLRTAICDEAQISDLPVQPHFEKYFGFLPTQITTVVRAVSSHQRGVSRSSRTRGGMQWTPMVLLTNSAGCVRRSRVVLMPRRWRQVCGDKPQATVTRKPDHRGDHGGNR